jgi:hypothetical protein
VRAAVVCALALLVAAPPARADERAERERFSGSVLIAIGAISATLSLSSFAVAGLIGECPPPDGGFRSPCLASVQLIDLGIVAIASGVIALPALSIGIPLRRAGDNDARAAALSLPPGFFAERAHRRRRIGIPLTIAGVALAAAGIGFGAGAWDATENYPRRDRFPAMVGLASVTGVIGVALTSVGATLATLGK